MRRFEYGRVESRELHARVVAALAVECGGKADVLGLLGEIVARRAFVPEGFADPRDYCARALGMSADQALRRLRAARTVHAFPALLPAVDAGRLGVTAINTLGPHLSAENCRELAALAAGRTIEELERALRARRAPAPVVRRVGLTAQLLEKLEYAKALLAHVTHDEGAVLERALDALIVKLEARKFAKTERPRAARAAGASSGSRYIPADERRKVYMRDGGRCTFVGDHGHRCETRDALQFDHVVTFAEGGTPTADNLRLRCRAHNQLEAERRFGAEFMRRKRATPRERKALAPELEAKRSDLVAVLQTLGYNATQAKWAAAQCADRLQLSLEGLIKHALTYLAPASARRREAPAPAA